MSSERVELGANAKCSRIARGGCGCLRKMFGRMLKTASAGFQQGLILLRSGSSLALISGPRLEHPSSWRLSLPPLSLHPSLSPLRLSNTIDLFLFSLRYARVCTSMHGYAVVRACSC